MQEKRGYVRLEVDAQAGYSTKGQPGKQSAVALSDISLKGMRVICRELLKPGEGLSLRLKIPGIARDLSSEGRIAWQRKIGVDLFDTGMEFTLMPDADKEELRVFLDKITGRTIERREFVRYPLAVPVKYWLRNDPLAEKICCALDISICGLKVLSSEALDKGTQLKTCFRLPEDPEEIVALCTVVAWSKKQDEHRFELGIEFLEISTLHQQKIDLFIRKKLGS